MYIQLEAELLDGCQVINRVGHHTFIVDEAYGLGGTDLGPNPMQMFLSAIASAYAISCQQLAQKQKVKIHYLKISLECDAQTVPFSLTPDVAGPNQSLLNPVYFDLEISTDLKAAAEQSFLIEVDRSCALFHTLKSKGILTEK